MQVRTDVVVIGAGAVGLWTAFRLAARGAAVTVLDPDPARGATWTAAGMLAPTTEYAYGEEGLLQLMLAAAARYPDDAAELAGASGLNAGYQCSGAIEVAWDAADIAALRDLASRREQLGLRSRRLGSRELRRVEPGLAPDVSGALLSEDDHQIDNRMMVGALLSALRAMGAEIRAEAARRIVLDGDRAVGVESAGGETLGAQWIVLAAGAHSALLSGLPEAARLPIRPVKGQTLRVRSDRQILRRIVRGRVRGTPIYVVPRAHGEIVIGASSEEAGFDRRPRVGAMHDLLRDAVLIVPELAEAHWVEVSTGLRPSTPDNAPIIGPLMDGLIVASGHYRNGILLAPMTATAVADLIGGAPPDPLIAAFGPDRFALAGSPGGPR